MATSIRIHVGLRTYQLEPRFAGGDGEALPLTEARALLRRIHDGPAARQLRAYARSLCRSTLEWEDDLHVIEDLLRTGRLRMRPVEAYALVPSAQQEAPEVEHEPVENEIVETHTVEIELVDADGNPVPGEPYRITLPDGSTRTGTLDDRGYARVAGIEQAGTCKVCFYKRDAAAWGPA